VTLGALFTKFDPRAFLEAGPGANNAGSGAVELATLAALAERTPNVENQPVRDAVVTDHCSFRNQLLGLQGAKAAKPAKDEHQTRPFLTSFKADQSRTIVTRAYWNAEDWRARFEERAGFLEHDCGLLRVEAEHKAFDSCIVEWLNCNPSSSPDGRCTWCGRPETPSATVLPFGAGEHPTWLHAECWPAWHQRRRAEADMALRKMGLAPGSSSGRLP
jgi:hypothetical protein